MQTTGYRADIDALRGVSILAVVLYHVGVPGFGGGFVGVDVFFVISGYLITQQLLRKDRGALVSSLADFYARRARRILPALSLLLMVVLVVGWLLFLPTGEQQDLGRSSVATALFSSNFFFWREARDYFALGAESQPLLHTWSLAVEEQFYLLWPILLLWQGRKSPARGIYLICAAIGISFLIAVVWVKHDPGGGFYNTPSRVWELGVGGLLSAGGWSMPRRTRWLGIAMILVATVSYTALTPFPGYAALLPVGGAAIVLTSNGTPVGGAPLIQLGRVSYSWYLWHWPALVIARRFNMYEHSLRRDLVAALMSLGIAVVSTSFVEAPLRRRTSLSGWRLARASAAMILLPAVLGAGLYGLARHSYRANLAPHSIDCLQHGPDDPSCYYMPGTTPTLLLTGDSHANHWAPAIAKWAKLSRVSVVERSGPSCATILQRNDQTACGALGNRAWRDLIAARPHLPVIIGVKWEMVSRSDSLRSARLAELDEVLDSLRALNVRALVIGPTPVFPHSVPLCLSQRTPEECRIPRPSSEIELMISGIVVKHPNARLWNPLRQFCDESWCYPERQGQLAFRDDNHITRIAAIQSEPDLSPALAWLMSGSELAATHQYR